MAGRTTTYTPTVAEAVTAHLSKGRSLSAFAAETGIPRKSLYNWRAKHPAFDAACGTRPVVRDEEVPVTLRPAGAIIFSLAAWGLPSDLAHPSPPAGTLTEEDVDARLFKRQMEARAA